MFGSLTFSQNFFNTNEKLSGGRLHKHIVLRLMNQRIMEMENNEQSTITPAEEKVGPVIKIRVENARGKEKVQESILVNKMPVSPAPFYDELHFADYE